MKSTPAKTAENSDATVDATGDATGDAIGDTAGDATGDSIGDATGDATGRSSLPVTEPIDRVFSGGDSPVAEPILPAQRRAGSIESFMISLIGTWPEGGRHRELRAG
ncbi:hypothetical protein ACFL41_00335 [Gemmatimonadota bacterium]